MAENLVIVESPAKAKTIEKFLGSQFIVKSSFGHVRDLSKKDLGINLKQNFEPQYEISADKKKLVADLKKYVKDAKTIWLASDEDREGEAIAWHLYEVLKLQPDSTKRIVFHEITKDAILHSIQNPRIIDTKLVDAQQARRILDRIVGFELSPVLWKKVKPSLSAGRVQSVSVRIIVEREREIIHFKSSSSFKVVALFSVFYNNKTYSFSAELQKKFETEQKALSFLESSKGIPYKIDACENKPISKSPAPPFTTSTLQQEAGRKLGFPVAKTMSVAQKLYEEGYITYMRTDSVNLSDLAIATTKSYIVKEFGNEYSKTRKYATKSKGAQEAHEAIRPTYVQNEIVSANSDEQRLYDLIRKRTIASQMADVQIARTLFTINCKNDTSAYFSAKGEVVTFDGFYKVYKESSDDDTVDEQLVILPPLQLGASLKLESMTASERFTQHPPRYTEATLVRKLEELGIGRPSTYAPTISTIQKRGYVIKEDRIGEKREITVISLQNNIVTKTIKSEVFGSEKSKLFPTDIGMVVNDFLVKYFGEILDYNFTAQVESQFDEIAEGQLQWQNMIKNFYDSFHPTVEKTIEESERGDGERLLGLDPKTERQVFVRIGRFGPMVQLGSIESEEKPVYASLSKGQLIETLTLEEALDLLYNNNDGNELGIDKQTGKKVYVKSGRYGPFVQLGETNDADKKYVSLLKGQKPESITLEQALTLLKLPRYLGEFESKKVEVNIGKFGPFISHNSSFISLKKSDPDVFSISLDQAISCILAKRENDIAKHIKTFEEDKKIKVMLDRWGKPCVFYKKRFFRITKNIKPEMLTLQQCYEIAGEKK
ncbi:MAG: DNA topoisomerase 1 [Bacteroidetes bacterium ADurb.Bin217]|nr:MAG: DNA topoisomerase 1 [Bacteroidetes bacterium ADurb.Bin217]